MNTREVCSLYQLTDAKGDGHQGVFVLGSFCSGERVAVSSQQTRALNLVHSLFAEKQLGPGSRVCVVGGGAAGLTAAAYAIAKEAVVTVLESHDLLWNLRGCRTRWLHPNLFRCWPHEDWKCTGTNFPVMNWYAGYASEVGELMHLKYLSFEAMQESRGSRRYLRYPGHQFARGIQMARVTDGWRVSWVTPKDSWSGGGERFLDVFDAVIVATGFGSEARTRDAEASLYWLDDTLERERPSGRQMRYLISGTGDGGLTDLLRIRVKGFRHHHLRDCLLDIDMYAGEIEAGIREIEARAKADEGFDVTAAYQEIARTKKLGRMMKDKREGTSVVLTNDRVRGGALESPAWRVSKFLAAQLLVSDELNTTFRRGPAIWSPQFTGVADRDKPAPHPERFEASFAAGEPSGEFDAVVVRHGTERFKHGKWEKEIRAIDLALTEFGFEPAVIKAASDKWSQANNLRMVTDQLIEHEAGWKNCEMGLRSRAHTVLPAMGGRTVIGMLSRLVSSVAPEASEALEYPQAEISGSLVSDDVAELLTPIALRMPRGSSDAGGDAGDGEKKELEGDAPEEDDPGWRLGAEINRREAIDIIWAADLSMEDLWARHSGDFEILERNWVLPRAPWVPKAPLLKHACVARHWGPWQLKYIRDEVPIVGRKPRSRAARRRHLLERLAKIPRIEAKGERPTLTIVDYCAVQHRVAIVYEGCSRSWRLARELQARAIYMAWSQELLDIIDDS